MNYWIGNLVALVMAVMLGTAVWALVALINGPRWLLEMWKWMRDE